MPKRAILKRGACCITVTLASILFYRNGFLYEQGTFVYGTSPWSSSIVTFHELRVIVYALVGFVLEDHFCCVVECVVKSGLRPYTLLMVNTCNKTTR